MMVTRDVARVSLCVPFYRNQGMLAHQYAEWVAYPLAVKMQVEILIVDDDSPEPAAGVPRPYGLPTLRIFRLEKAQEHPPWRQHAGRNLMASKASGEWLLMTDMDHIVPATSLQRLLAVLPGADPDDVLQFWRVDAPDLTVRYRKDGQPHLHTNSYAVRKARYWAVGGHDEDLHGYGTDSFFLKRLKSKGTTLLKDVPIIRYSRDVIPDASTRVDRVKARRKQECYRELARKEAAKIPPTVLSVRAEQVL